MFKVPTTLVLGAGASEPYGFPTGRTLREGLCSQFQPDYGPVPNLLYDSRVSWSDLQRFAQFLNRSQFYSIDAFLAHRPEFSEVGKRAIAWRLISHEHPMALLKSDDHWYQYLWNSINESWEEFGKNLQIITFNYDRSLEWYLADCLSVAFKKTNEQTKR